jgi:hypothetical protein
LPLNFVFLTGSNDDFNAPPYLTSAMRFTVSGISREPTEEEILDDVENLGFDTSDDYHFDNSNADLEWLGENIKPIYVDDLPGDLTFPPTQKRYDEFLGKRQSGTRHKSQRINTNSALKRWAEFVGKRNSNNRIYNPNREYSKRYMEFLGKRSSLGGDGFERKRYSEFLG